MRAATAARAERGRVGIVPLREVLPGFTIIAAPWALVVLGRLVCLVAQRVPPLVWLVRTVITIKERRAQRRRAMQVRAVAAR